MGIYSAVLENRRLSDDWVPESLKLEDTDETATTMVGVWRHCSRSTVRGAGHPPPVLELDDWPVADAAAVGPGAGANSRMKSSRLVEEQKQLASELRVLGSADVLSIVQRINASSATFSPQPSLPHLSPSSSSDSNPDSEPRLSSDSASSRHLTNTNMNIHNVRALPILPPAPQQVPSKIRCWLHLRGLEICQTIVETVITVV